MNTVDCENNQLFKEKANYYASWQNPHQFIVFQQEKRSGSHIA